MQVSLPICMCKSTASRKDIQIANEWLTHNTKHDNSNKTESGKFNNFVVITDGKHGMVAGGRWIDGNTYNVKSLPAFSLDNAIDSTGIF